MKKVFLMLLLIGFVASCGRPYAPGQSVDAPQESNKILLLDHGLTYYLKVLKHKAVETEDGRLLVKVEIENEEDNDVPTDIQVVFKGKDGFEVEKTSWEPLIFHRRAVTSIQRKSLSTDAANYLLQIRNIK